MTNSEFLELARSQVPQSLHQTARIVKHEAWPTLGLAASRSAGSPKSFDQAMAAELGVALPPPADEQSADVVFDEVGKIGRRSTVVQIRNGKVANVLRRG
ncbi:MAG: hypothetical protein KGN16_24250 [Burkholderiales bacterium]|nr:hypothetical protein [Burkholderiales bacterium]